MRKELQDKLFEKYPKIFRQKNLSIKETAMCWGIDTGDGWYKIIDLLCYCLQWDIDNNKYPQVEATQVKEKFGGLRFYTNSENDHQSGMIRYTEHLSGITCETCGSMEDITQTKGWIVTLCPKCMEKYKREKGLL
jgi:hypothetical protein